jgi:hypothetical protein
MRGCSADGQTDRMRSPLRVRWRVSRPRLAGPLLSALLVFGASLPLAAARAAVAPSAAFRAASDGLRAASAAVSVPLDASSPWPEMRHDAANSGRSTIVAAYHGDPPWAFHTGRGIFSTPVIGGDGTVYIGSGDTYFYALDSRGRLRWRLKTGGLIDAAAALSSYDPSLGSSPLTFGSADQRLYHLTTPRAGRPRMSGRRGR